MKFLWQILNVSTHLLCCSLFTSCPLELLCAGESFIYLLYKLRNWSVVLSKGTGIHLQREFLGIFWKKGSWGYLCSVWALTSSASQTVHWPLVVPPCPKNYLCCWSCHSSSSLSAMSCWWTSCKWGKSSLEVFHMPLNSTNLPFLIL